MNTVIINENNGFTAVTFVNEKKRQKDESETDFANRIAKKNIKGDYHLCKQNELPDFDFQEAWEIKNKKATVNMKKARKIHMQRIRKKRNEKLAELDIQQLADKDVKAEKQALRDIPQKFDLSIAKNTDELKALWPEELI